MQQDILSEIIENKRIEIIEDKKVLPLSDLKELVKNLPPTRSMKESISKSRTGIISEFKRRSPSKGWIKEDAKTVDIVPEYEKAGAAAVSILTDTKYFGGEIEDIISVRDFVKIPILRKEFIIDEYQIYQARLIDADAILLIAAALTIEECDKLIDTAHELDLEVLLEIHSVEELAYISDKVDMVGVNNRNLGSFHTDVNNSFELAKSLPEGMVKISESGISNPETVSQLLKAGFKGFLIGENFMKTDNPGLALSEFIGKIE